MKLNIRTASKQLFANSKVYYVPSKSGGEEHIVVQANGTLFCDCKDFMTRHLPLLGTAGFSHCTHGKQVVAYSMNLTINRARKPAPKKTYGIFTPYGYRSSDLPGTYSSLKDAKQAIERHELLNGRFERYARAL